ncbi:penicillin-binding protein 2 [Thermoanaerobacter mathranii subsp. mathranii str. A3]|uniref:Penicillin-binding protein 2 n=1 Tax=Thermoanaerobacter mathranii subsp. mathranii (strain DSM 11426 / CCUG 53645 / CIP 108742 / A3) TaxID=583358 RepID=A0ABN3Z1G4_THEM3|nr:MULTISPECIES: penicillin-binding protein 2 [Thermoanaerobacter]ADH60612.1 penicillin-binding protein 2 [Thermoanaerobacter mathranii subsp. mathranii str. A3]MBT1280392.1 penicillin-binding protein 2 [Thermoanaerobacter sp. CM-CNRG TB177]
MKVISLNESLKRKFYTFGAIIIALFVVLVFRLVYLQLIKGDYYREMSIRQAIRLIPIDAPRGEIVDRYGVKLATNRPSFSVNIIKGEVVDSHLNETILKLMDILTKNNVKYKDDLPIYLDENGRPYFNFKNSDEVSVKEETLKAREKAWKKANNIPENATAQEAWDILTKKFKISKDMDPIKARKIMVVRQLMEEQGYNQYQPVEIAVDVDQKTIAEIEERHLELPGIMINVKPVRYYPYKTLLSQTLGYIGRITHEDLKNLDMTKYKLTDLVGHSGLEALYEKYLRGKDGGQQVVVDNYGRLIENLGTEQPVPGSTIFLTIDKNIQEAAEQSLITTMQNIKEGKYGESFPANIGAAVVVDVHTGKVLALANIPGYDPNIFATGNPPKDVINELFKSRDTTIDPSPIFNYAAQGAVPPGSIFKMVVAFAALDTGVTTVDEKYLDPGIYPYTGQRNWAWPRTQGWVNVSDAIKYSTNTYFFEMGRRMGIDKIVEYAKKFGLDQKTGIELYETKGVIASPQYKKEYYLGLIKSMVKSDKNPDGVITEEQYQKIIEIIEKENLSDYNTFLQLEKMGIKDTKLQRKLWEIMYYAKHWSLAETCSAAIGQGDNQFTPLQIASYVSTLINGGIRYRLHLVDKIVSPDGKIVEETKPEVLERIDIPKEYLDAIKLGMKEVTELGGTASSAFRNFPIPVGGKTGTAEAIGKANYAWFVGFAPYDDPQIVVVVVIYQGGHGSYAGYVARDIFNVYFGLSKDNTGETFNVINLPIR